ncbi:hypothetical protein GpartN1_g2077.t1 [Galdieria partita]|uniref:Mg-protoporphyrin IX chelatase n=1 Tax=Galdieria partita TaxID=83374 RepID=A0A9C7UP81_9RHOD|nr:hypothetical protein GpartN1_g2077.t1 [Galdieria partita]
MKRQGDLVIAFYFGSTCLKHRCQGRLCHYSKTVQLAKFPWLPQKCRIGLKPVWKSTLSTTRCLATTPSERNVSGKSQVSDSLENARYSDFPLAAVVGQDAVKVALLLAAVNKNLRGIILSGRRGTGKSIMARAIHALLPPIEIQKGSFCNLPPESNSDEVVIMKPHFVQIPLNVTEDRLLGSVDIEESLSRGEPVFQPGILAKANRGVLYVDELNLLDDSIVNILLSVLADGQVVVEREGFSVIYPCEPLFIATYNVEEGEIRPHVLDRFAVSLSVDNEPLTHDQRTEAVNISNMFSDKRHELIDQFNEETQEIASRIIFSREFLNDVVITKEQIEYLCTEASRGQCIGHRGEVFAVEAAKASAALDNRDYVSEEDLRTAVKLVLVPRAMCVMNNEQQPVQETRSQPPPPSSSSSDVEPEDIESKEQEESNSLVPEEFMFDPEGGIVDPNLLQFASKQKIGRSGKRGTIYSFDRGRYIKPVLPRGDTWRIALDATLRAAAPLQKMRRERYKDIKSLNDHRVYIRNQDIRIKKMSKKAGTLVIFLVDASGSMALNRMNAAKGAAIRLLSSAYESRDKISLISFQGENAQILLPPTRSVAMAKRRMETMPCGGGSPLAHGLFLASKVGIQALSTGDVGQAIIVLISDGRANIPLSQSLGEASDTKKSKAELKQEVLEMARKIAALSKVKLLCIDTENKFVSTGIAKDIADSANGTYNYLPKATDSAVASLAGQVISSINSSF